MARAIHYKHGRFAGHGLIPVADGQGEMKSTALILVCGYPEATSVGLNNGSADGQPHAHSFRFRGEERFKNPLQVLSFNPFPAIAHFHLDRIVAVPHGFDA